MECDKIATFIHNETTNPTFNTIDPSNNIISCSNKQLGFLIEFPVNAEGTEVIKIAAIAKSLAETAAIRATTLFN